MEIVRSQSCQKHNEQVNFMCTRVQCFRQKNILICKSCFRQHSTHASHVIELNLLNMKVVALMKKRMQYEQHYDQACDQMIKELKVFKSFKEQLVNRLNMRERDLNEICKKIRRHLRYEKDEQLFKCNFGHIYLSMRARNQNVEMYRSFRKHLQETASEIHHSLLRFNFQTKDEIPLLTRKDYQVCELVKAIPQKQLVPEINFTEPDVKCFRKEIIKFKFKDQFGPNIVRLNEEEFLTYNTNHEIVRWYNSRNLMFPRQLLFGSPVENMVIMGRHAFCSSEGGGIKIFDMLHEKVVKDFASSNQKQAKITDLLPVSGNSVFSFITSPNQIVNFRFNDVRQTLELIKGIETPRFKVWKSLLMEDQFYTACDDFRVRGFNPDSIQQIFSLKFDSSIRTMSKFNSQTLLVGGEMNKLCLIDLRCRKIANEARINSFCRQLQKITDNGVIYSWGRSIMMMDMRMLKDVLGTEADGTEIHCMRGISSSLFVTSSCALHLWHLVN